MAARTNRALHVGSPRQAGVPARQSHHGARRGPPRALAKARGVLRPRRGHMLRREGRAVLPATTGRLARLWKRCRQVRKRRLRQLLPMITTDISVVNIPISRQEASESVNETRQQEPAIASIAFQMLVFC